MSTVMSGSGSAAICDDRGSRRRRILLVEDSSTLRKLIRRALLSEPVDLQMAENGLEAVRLSEEAEEAGEPFDLVLMDVVMPELNGVEATWQLRQKGFRGRVVILTAADTQFDMAASLCAGADDYLAKPFTPQDLHRVVSGADGATTC